MSTLSNRIAWLHRPTIAPNGDVDSGVGNREEMSFKHYGDVKSIPLVRIQVYPGGVIAYDEPLITPDGAPISATGPAQWGQLYAAGRY